MELDEMLKELEKPVNLNAEEPLTDEQIRERNKKYVEEVLDKEKEIVAPNPPSQSEIQMMRDRIGTERVDSYPKKMPDAVKPKIGTEEPTVDVKTLNFKKPYDPNDFFPRIKPTPEFIEAIRQKLREEYDSPHQIINGKKVYQTYYYNQEVWCLELFFEAIDWDVKIVEAVMHDLNTKLKADIAGIGFATLAYWARGKK